MISQVKCLVQTRHILGIQVSLSQVEATDNDHKCKVFIHIVVRNGTLDSVFHFSKPQLVFLIIGVIGISTWKGNCEEHKGVLSALHIPNTCTQETSIIITASHPNHDAKFSFLLLHFIKLCLHHF
jgi:hypothetical protein